MRVIGIIAEYNPFHNGHAYQIKKIKEDFQADFVVIALSGDFVQRGTPAIIDKYARTQMALSCGADLVVELPVLWATASAEAFAMAGVTLFDKMGCVDGICFGAETDDLDLLSIIADVFILEPKAYRTLFSSYLKDGLTFPLARSKALCQYFIDTKFQNTSVLSNNTYTHENAIEVSEDPSTFNEYIHKISKILNEPNNILAIEYLKALKRRNSSITPYIIKRQGAGYHDETILSSASTVFDTNAFSKMNDVPTASATAIRTILKTKNYPLSFQEQKNTNLQTSDISLQKNNFVPNHNPISFEDTLKDTMPLFAFDILTSYLKEKAELYSDDFSTILGYKLLTSNPSILANIGDSNLDLANRIFKNRMNLTFFEQFCELNKSKDITYTRISRVLLHLILEITNDDYILGKELDYIPYLRILGFRTKSSALLKTLKNTATIPVISKLADAKLNTDSMKLLEKDIFAANLYEQICGIKRNIPTKNEFTRTLVRF